MHDIPATETNVINEQPKSGGSTRQRRYRARLEEREQHYRQQLFAHHNYRVQLNIALARSQRPTDWLAARTGVDHATIETGDYERCGLFMAQEIAAIQYAMPHVPAPPKNLW